MSFTQADVGEQLGYSDSNICEFEKGRNNNILIFMWYISHGLTMTDAYKAFISEEHKNG